MVWIKTLWEVCVCLCVIKPGCFSQGTVCKQREKVVSSNSCFPKWSYPCLSQSEPACGGSHSSVGWSQHTLHSEDQTLTHYASFLFIYFIKGWFIVAFMWRQLYLVAHQNQQDTPTDEVSCREPPHVSYVGFSSLEEVFISFTVRV